MKTLLLLGVLGIITSCAQPQRYVVRKNYYDLILENSALDAKIQREMFRRQEKVLNDVLHNDLQYMSAPYNICRQTRQGSVRCLR